MIGTFFSPVVCRMAHILFTLSVFVCVEWCPTHIVLCFSFACLLFVYPLLPVSLDCPFLITPSVFSSVYLQSSWYKCTLNHLLFNLCPEASANVDSDMWYAFFFIDKKHHILKHYFTIVYFNGHFTSNSSYVGIKQQFLSYYT